MTNLDHPVLCYQQLSDLCAQMLQAARDADWDRIGPLEISYSSEVQRLDRLAVPPSPELRAKLADMIRHILVDESEVRSMVAQRMSQLSALASSAGTERKLARAYGGR